MTTTTSLHALQAKVDSARRTVCYFESEGLQESLIAEGRERLAEAEDELATVATETLLTALQSEGDLYGDAIAAALDCELAAFVENEIANGTLAAELPNDFQASAVDWAKLSAALIADADIDD